MISRKTQRLLTQILVAFLIGSMVFGTLLTALPLFY